MASWDEYSYASFPYFSAWCLLHLSQFLVNLQFYLLFERSLAKDSTGHSSKNQKEVVWPQHHERTCYRKEEKLAILLFLFCAIKINFLIKMLFCYLFQTDHFTSPWNILWPRKITQYVPVHSISVTYLCTPIN